MLELVISHTTATDNWIKRHHYLHSTPAGAVIRMEFWISMQETAELCTEAELVKSVWSARCYGDGLSALKSIRSISSNSRAAAFLMSCRPTRRAFVLPKPGHGYANPNRKSKVSSRMHQRRNATEGQFTLRIDGSKSVKQKALTVRGKAVRAGKTTI